MLQLLGVAGSLVFLHIAFCGLGFNTPLILASIGFSADGSVYHRLYNAALDQLVLLSAGVILGYWVTVLTIDAIGRQPIQIAGLTILTILFAIIGFCLESLGPKSLLALYILAQFFFNFGKPP